MQNVLRDAKIAQIASPVRMLVAARLPVATIDFAGRGRRIGAHRRHGPWPGRIVEVLEHPGRGQRRSRADDVRPVGIGAHGAGRRRSPAPLVGSIGPSLGRPRAPRLGVSAFWDSQGWG